MGLLEKLKNTFFEEEYIEVEEDTKKKEVKPLARKVEIKPKKEEKKVEKVEIKEEPKEEIIEEIVPESYADKELLKKDSSVHYFEDDDFVEVKPPTPVKKAEPVKIYGEDPKELYSRLDYQTSEVRKPYSNSDNKTGFKPTPVISPIYGVLDKNYRKEEVVDKKDKPSSYVSRRNADLDFVRNKAFGKLEDDMMMDSFSDSKELNIEDTDNDVEIESNLLVDMTDNDATPFVEKVTIADAEEYFEDLGLEYNVDYKDSRYEKATGRRSKVVVEKEEPEVPVQEENDTISEDNLFDLIDSMYEDKE